MKEKRLKNDSSNGGYSLIELIVTVLISSVIMVAVVGFLTTGLRHYRDVNSETLLQMESQVAELFITELFQEAKDFRVIDNTAYPANVTYAVEIKRDATYMLALVNGELWFSQVTKSTDGENISELIGKGRSQTFLAKYVNNFEIGQFDGNTTFTEVALDHGLVCIDVEYKVDEKQYDSNMLIALKNAKRN